MKNVIFGLLMLLGFVVLNRCSTEVDLYADFKDITIVFGVLDYTDDTSWIKITKAYSGPGNALVMAQNPDSSNYPYKLDVKLTGTKQGDNLAPIIFDTLTINNKKAGDSIFYYPDQLMYFAVGELDVDANYTLTVMNKDEETTSETQLIPKFSITYPKNTINFTTNNNTIDWNSGKYGKRYEVYYTFNYQELLPGTTDTSWNSMNWKVGDYQLSQSTDGGEKMHQLYIGDAFYSKLNADLEHITNVQRWAGPLQVYVSAGSQVLQNYISINDATGSLLTEVPTYSNIKNGTGIFAARHTSLKTSRISNKSLEVLVEDYDLGFKYPTENK